MNKTNIGLVAYVKAMVGNPYWYGCFGQISTEALYEAKKKQYPKYYTWSCPSSQLGKKVFDCVGLIKGYLWSTSTTAAPKYYEPQDVSANGMYDVSKKKGSIGTMPKVPGVLVFKSGHVGVYIGDGKVVEAKGHAYGVITSNLSTGGWTKWSYCPWIDYITESSSTLSNQTSTKTKLPTYSIGKTYTVMVNDLAVRVDAGTNKRQKKRSELTSNAWLHSTKSELAYLKKSTRVTCKDTKVVDGNVWMLIPSGWIAAYYNGKYYVK